MNPRAITVLAALNLAFTLSACDPGYRLRPIVGVEQADSHRLVRMDGFDIRTEAVRGLVGESWLTLRLEVSGNSRQISLRQAGLRIDDSTYPATSFGPAVPPGGGNTGVAWDLKSPMYLIVKDRAEVDLGFEYDSQAQRLTLSYALGK